VTAFVLACALPAFVAFTTIAALRGSAWARRLSDHPNSRSLHSSPTPRIGGIGIAAALAPVAFLSPGAGFAAIAACAAALFVVSLADDHRGLPIQVRLPAHFAAAVVVVLALADGSTWPWGWPGTLLVVLAIAWATNLYNFMDGADGLAGGMGLIGFGALAIAAGRSGQPSLALACAAIASACAGFLPHNFPPARVFLGDCGAIPLGFLAGALGLAGTVSGAWPQWFAPLVFSPFVADATVTIVLRILRGERFWIAHRTHAYQQLVLAGWSKRRLAASAWMLMAAAAGSALVAREAGGHGACVILFVWLAAYAVLFAAVRWLTRRKALAARVDTDPTPRMPE
jgi:UDP-GlcNAc:undecaprenyl-phosphate GlcNAc-1-phosphate transferase